MLFLMCLACRVSGPSSPELRLFPMLAKYSKYTDFPAPLLPNSPPAPAVAYNRLIFSPSFLVIFIQFGKGGRSPRYANDAI